MGDVQLSPGGMPGAGPAEPESGPARSQLSPARASGIGLALAAAAVVLWGGYGHSWPWTGINGRTATLWDWLNLLLLPIAFGVLPILVSRRTHLQRQHRFAAVIAMVVLVVLVVAGYAVPWKWTGFAGNKLWDWLELLALPLAVTLVPLVDDIRLKWTGRHSFAVTLGLAAFVAIVIGGYVGNWSWTGFHGNTLWDWLHLLLLPLLLPTVVVPALKPRIEATMVVAEDGEAGQLPGGSDGEPGEPEQSRDSFV